MASIYKRRQDKSKRRAPWYIGYTDPNGKRKTIKGFNDKGATEQLAALLEEEARQIKAGLKPAPFSAGRETSGDVDQAVSFSSRTTRHHGSPGGGSCWEGQPPL